MPRVRVVQTIGAAHCVAYGGLMALFPERYTSASYAQPFRLLTATQWGLTFLVAGAIALGSLYGPWPFSEPAGRVAGATASMLLTAVMVAWSFALIWGVVIGEANTLAGPLWTVSMTAMYLSSAVRFGTGRQHGKP
jgi:hypothetical protein